jgi:hypothetical protein
MILVGSQRGGGANLAAHLINRRDNDHVTVVELRGFIGTTLREAFDEAHAISKATKAKQYLFSLSLNPPRDAEVDIEALIAAADRAEARLGLTGQPRTVVIHEKEGRRHAHAVWSRINAQALKAINHPFFKMRLAELSRDLFLEHGWELPEGHRTNHWKNPLNFTLADWQQAKRLGLDPREIKQVFQDAWRRSDDLKSFRHALEDAGYFLAKGDRRGFVALDIHGEPFAVPRWLGLKTKEVESRLGNPDGLPSVEDARQATKTRLSERVRILANHHRQTQANEREPFLTQRTAMVAQHRAEREKLRDEQEKRWNVEVRARADRLRGGLRGVVDLLMGRTRIVRTQNEREALACHERDEAQREELYQTQSQERRQLQRQMEEIYHRQRQERRRNARHIALLLRLGVTLPPVCPRS